MAAAVAALTTAISARTAAAARQAALDVDQARLALQLRHRPAVEIDRARLGVWARQLALDTAVKDTGAVAGDATTLTWIWDRVRHTVDQGPAVQMDSLLLQLRKAAEAEDLAAVSQAIPALFGALRIRPVGP